MKPDASAVEFAVYAASRWRQILVSCAAALVFAGAAGLVLPKSYTATATLLIQTPAGVDPRAATSVSPVYLESLRTYEHLALSDSIFAEAVERLGVRKLYPNRSIESLKSSVLKVSKPANTRILTISATLKDPKQAQALARYIAEKTTATNRDLDARSAADAARAAQTDFDQSERRLRDAEAADRDYVPAPSDKGGRETMRRDELANEVFSARSDRDAARKRLDEIKAGAPLGGERLEVLDPGIVPQRPSFPDTPLNMVVALVVSLAASLTYLAFRFGYERAAVHRHERVYSRIA
ncbi:MAG: hypothetical protein KGN84_03680 [Acidobacteriota bacterium]|nr:hypothetical protein [Acidobacteriota bacterium]